MSDLGKLFVVMCLFAALPGRAQGQEAAPPDEEGLPYYIEHYTPQDYQAHQQNWSLVQDQRGVVYVANNEGSVLEYDGQTWRYVNVPNNASVRSLAVDQHNRVFVGGKDEVGYLKTDSTGILKYQSLMDYLPTDSRIFQDVWGTHSTSEGVYYQSRRHLFRWDGRKMNTWRTTGGFHTSFVVRDRLYVREIGIGLKEMVRDSLRMVPEGTFFENIRVYFMAPYGDDQILIGTREAGFFLYDYKTLTPFAEEVHTYLEANGFGLYHGTVLHDGSMALATLGGGIIIMDQEGRLRRVMDQERGVPDPIIYYVYPDAQGGLWACLASKGIIRIDVGAPISQYDSTLGLDGLINTILRYKGTLYVGTTGGLYTLDQVITYNDGRPTQWKFQKVNGVPPTWNLVETPYGLLIATLEGIYTDAWGRISLITTDDDRTFALLASKFYKDRVYMAGKAGLSYLVWTENGWRQRRDVGIRDVEVRTMMEQADGTLWLGTEYNGVYRLQLHEGYYAPPIIRQFNDTYGLHHNAYVETVQGDPVFITEEGLFVYQGNDLGVGEILFKPDTRFNFVMDSASVSIRDVEETADGTVWVVTSDDVWLAHPEADGTFRAETVPILHYPKTGTSRLYWEADSIAWLGSGDQLVRYDQRNKKDYSQAYPALIRQVKEVGSGRLIYGGNDVITSAYDLDYSANDLAFTVSASSFNKPEETEYQYFLLGADDGWSPWTQETIKSYTNLKEGNYTFQVRARNGQGVLSAVGTFAFHVAPPWFRTWWAYTMFLVGFVVLMGFGVRYAQMMKAQKVAREQAKELARERTVNLRLQEANDQLRQANKLKDEFLATVSHELRTPLTAIMGFTNILKEGIPEDDPNQEFLGIIVESSDRLMNTLTSLLDLAMLRAGMVEMHPERIQVAERITRVLNAMSDRARAKGLQLELKDHTRTPFVWIDAMSVDRIVNKLVDNAIKFTDRGGVTVTLEADQKQLVIRVQDTGIGIDAEFLPDLFNEFAQESGGDARSHEGNGVGLAITSSLVRLMDGEISVESEKGVGSTFTVVLSLKASEEAAPKALPTGAKDQSISMAADRPVQASQGDTHKDAPVTRAVAAPPPGSA